MSRAYYSDNIETFLRADTRSILGDLSQNSEGAVEQLQIEAWRSQIVVLQSALPNVEGRIFFEYSIPRMGKRIDVALVTGNSICVIEFKVGSSTFDANAIDQVWDYALDLQNFHETSHDRTIVPILVATEAKTESIVPTPSVRHPNIVQPLLTGLDGLPEVLKLAMESLGDRPLESATWEDGRYSPTPTIIEAALALYRGHSVDEISRSDASATNLRETTSGVAQIISSAKKHGHKAICFVTGVPGAGKTLVGLDIATKHLQGDDCSSVFLSGNGPLVNVLQEALARDLIAREGPEKRISKREAISQVKAFVQNVHHYRDAYLTDKTAPYDHVALFDEAQRAWRLDKTSDFMKRRKNIPDFNMSEPEFLISCVDRHEDWGVVICLVGGGQEIHTGEAGISEWINALKHQFPDWHINISSRLTDSEYGAGKVLEEISERPNVHYKDDLHLSVSMRSFRAENLSLLVKQILDCNEGAAKESLAELKEKYPIVLTRDVTRAKDWVRRQASGSERYGMIVSSQAERLKPHAIDVKSPMNPIHWFLGEKNDTRSSYYLEAVATEFSVQGLELDWSCVTWDADLRHSQDGWNHRSFRGSKWQHIRKPDRQAYQLNAYRVLLTRARQGMAVVVPEGDRSDPTRLPEFYDPTYAYLESLGFETV